VWVTDHGGWSTVTVPSASSGHLTKPWQQLGCIKHYSKAYFKSVSPHKTDRQKRLPDNWANRKLRHVMH
jgi:hypothetical protein